MVNYFDVKQVRSAARGNVIHRELMNRLGINVLELHCIQNFTHRMSPDKAADWVNLLTSEFSSSKECANFCFKTHPERCKAKRRNK